MTKQGGVLNKQFDRKEIYEAIHREIADTYLKEPAGKDDARRGKKKPASKAPWIIAAAALAVCAILLFFKGNIDINVRILGEIPSAGNPDSGDGFYNPRDKGVYLVKGIEANGLMVSDSSFMGDARTYSRATGGELVLCNSKGYGWASYSIDLSEPLDMRKLDLKFSARGDGGDECLGIIVIDADNRAYRIEKDRSVRLSREWKAYAVSLRQIRNAVDLKNISAIRFEFGSLTMGNGSVATIYLKDIYVAKTKRIKWI